MSIRVSRGRQHGIVLISSLLLLLVITILALAMFRSMGLAEKIAGNVREKQRALHAATVAEQYAEWLIASNNISMTAVTCSATGNANNTTYNTVSVCSNALNNHTDPTTPYPATLPWTDGNGNALGYTYTLPSTWAMSLTAVNGSYENSYYKAPAFYIQYVGPAADAGGSVYRVDAVGYGGSPLSVAVVESMYEIGSGVKPLDQP
ncbi:MAG TPA: PilX N-terminal domain-containing pilus assembly protein [Steroidobacteraceae bacterium]|nr:PilX N-terminal domain-containing pilus assembly protein [Steroidobacteraceae bacterium]